mgnify:CR=1 FL=1
MKKLGFKLLVGGILIAACTLTSCKSNGYGCDYGFSSIEANQEVQEIDFIEEKSERFSYSKVTKE